MKADWITAHTAGDGSHTLLKFMSTDGESAVVQLPAGMEESLILQLLRCSEGLRTNQPEAPLPARELRSVAVTEVGGAPSLLIRDEQGFELRYRASAESLLRLAARIPAELERLARTKH